MRISFAPQRIQGFFIRLSEVYIHKNVGGTPTRDKI